MTGQVLPDAFTAGQAGRHDGGRSDGLIGEELPSQQAGTVYDPDEDPFQGFAALLAGWVTSMSRRSRVPSLLNGPVPQVPISASPVKISRAKIHHDVFDDRHG
jgi:hypothetical protein